MRSSEQRGPGEGQDGRYHEGRRGAAASADAAMGTSLVPHCGVMVTAPGCENNTTYDDQQQAWQQLREADDGRGAWNPFAFFTGSGRFELNQKQAEIGAMACPMCIKYCRLKRKHISTGTRTSAGSVEEIRKVMDEVATSRQKGSAKDIQDCSIDQGQASGSCKAAFPSQGLPRPDLD